MIKSSPYAQPLRDVLSKSLTLKSLTGDLLVLRDSQFANWRNVEAFFPGTVMSTEPMGSLGGHTRFEFGANGKASRVVLDWGGPNLDQPTERRQEATYRIEKTGDDKAPRTVTVEYTGEHDGIAETFDLKVQAPSTATGAAIFQLVPDAGTPEKFRINYSSIVGECDA